MIRIAAGQQSPVRKRSHRSFSVGAALLASVLPGCAINDRGIVHAVRYENQYGYIVHVNATGIHLKTLPYDFGLTVGSSETVYFIPKVNAPCPEVGLERLAQPGFGAVSGLVPQQDWEPLQRMREPVAVTSRLVGLSLSWQTGALKLTLGMRESFVLRVPAASSALLLLKSPSHDPAGGQFFFWEANNPCSGFSYSAAVS